MSKSFQVRFLPDDVIAHVYEHTTVLDAARIVNLNLAGYCGGNGTCGKCMVEVLEGPECGNHPACRLRVHADMVLRIPEKGDLHTLIASTEMTTDFSPAFCCRSLSAIHRTIGDCRSEWELFRDALGIDVTASLPLISSLTNTENTFALLLRNELLAFSANEPAPCMAAFDIGTTSIVCYLLDGQSGVELAVSNSPNPQASYGADVISRARYVIENAGGHDLQSVIINAMNELLAEACTKSGVSPSTVYLLAIAGNTCMHHLLLGLSPASLVTAPYNAMLRHSITLDATMLGIEANPHAKLRVLPNIAGFVGADTVAGLIACELANSEQLMLLIDIGTNGELVLGSKSARIACSTAAGPAFEGANIYCGMCGISGAIDHVTLHGNTFHYTVIGGGKPKGICGSGLVDLVAALLDRGLITTSGRFHVAPAFAAHFTTVNSQPAFLLDNGVVLTQKDVYELQLAKAAMVTGIRLLCMELGVSIGDIQTVKIAGAFGNYLDAHSACRIGLLPAELFGRIEGIGNAAGEGVKRSLRNPMVWDSADDLAHGTRFLELATHATFQDWFVDELSFPEQSP